MQVVACLLLIPVNVLEYVVSLMCHCLTSSDVMTVGPWNILNELKDANLQRNLQRPAEALPKSRATATTRKYLGIQALENMGFPVEATHLALYLQHLGETRAS